MNTISIEMAQLSAAVYLSKPDGSPGPERIRFACEQYDIDCRVVVPISVDEVQAMFVETDRYRAVVFRGTDPFCTGGGPMHDWIRNLDSRSVKTEFGNLHNGFYAGFIKIRNDVYDACQEHGVFDAKMPPKPFYLAGHSQGGALAVVAAAHMDGMVPERIAGLFTYGQPRCFKAAAARTFHGRFACSPRRYFRYINRTDPVPRMPPALLGFRHAGELRFIDHRFHTHINPGFAYRLLDAARGVCDLVRGLDKYNALDEHGVANYIDSIKGAMPLPTVIYGKDRSNDN